MYNIFQQIFDAELTRHVAEEKSLHHQVARYKETLDHCEQQWKDRLEVVVREKQHTIQECKNQQSELQSKLNSAYVEVKQEGCLK